MAPQSLELTTTAPTNHAPALWVTYGPWNTMLHVTGVVSSESSALRHKCTPVQIIPSPERAI